MNRACRGWRAVALALLTTACRAETRAPAQTAESTAAAAPAPASREGPLPPDPCPLIGAWEPCKVDRRLKEAGLVVTRQPDAAPHPVAGVRDASYLVGGGPAELHVWLFADSSARLSAFAGLDSVTAMPRGTFARWPGPPTLIASGNLLAVMVSENDRLAERVALALGAGMPPR